MRTQHRAQQIVGVSNVGHPVADRFVDGILQRLAATGYAVHLGTQQPHAEHIQLLAAHVFFAHVDFALQVEQRASRRGGHAVLAGAGFCDDAPLSHALCQQGLPQTIVDLVSARVVQIFPLQIDPGATEVLRQSFGAKQWRRTPGVFVEQPVELGLKRRIVLYLQIRLFQFLQRMHQSLGRKLASVRTKMPLCIRPLIKLKMLP